MKTITVLNDNRTIADKIEEIEKKGWKYVKCEDVHDEHDIPYGDRMLLASKAKLYFEQEQEMQALDQALSSEDEEIECRCGQLVRADRLHEHSCPPDPAGEMRALENNRTWKAYLRGELD